MRPKFPTNNFFKNKLPTHPLANDLGWNIATNCKLLLHYKMTLCLNSLSTNPTKSSNTLKQVVSNLPTDCLSVFDHFVKLALKGLNLFATSSYLLLSLFAMFLSMVITFAIFLIRPFKKTISYHLDLYKSVLKISKMWFWIKPRFDLRFRNTK